MACHIPIWYTHPKTVTHPGTNRIRRALTSFMRRTPLTTTPRRQPIPWSVRAYVCLSVGHHRVRLHQIKGLLQLRFEHDSSTIRARFERDSSTIRARHATTCYEVFRALAYEIDSSTPRESVIGVSCMLIDSSMHTIFTLYLYRPTLHRVCEYARNCLYKRN